MKKTATAILMILMMLLSVPAYASASTADLDLFNQNDNTDSGDYVGITNVNIDDNGINDDGNTDIIKPNNQTDDNNVDNDDTTDINGQPEDTDDDDSKNNSTDTEPISTDDNDEANFTFDPRIDIETVTTSEGNRVRFLGINTSDLNYIKFEVIVQGSVEVEYQSFTDMPEGSLTTSPIWANPEAQMFELKWRRTINNNGYRETSLADIYLTAVEPTQEISAIVNIHVVECIKGNRTIEAENIGDREFHVEFAASPIPQPDPFDDSCDRIQIQVADEHLITVEAWTKANAYIVIAAYDDSGRQISVSLTPISILEKGGRNSYAALEVTPTEASIIKAMLVNESFQPLCEATTSRIEPLEDYESGPFYCGTPELEHESEQNLISVDIH